MDSNGSEGIVSALENITEHLGIRSGLACMGVKDSDIELLSKNAFRDPCLATNPNLPV